MVSPGFRWSILLALWTLFAPEIYSRAGNQTPSETFKDSSIEAKSAKRILPSLAFVHSFSLHLQDNSRCQRSEKSSSEFQQKSNAGIPENAYLNLVMEIKKNGSFKIIKVTQIPGQVILKDFPTSDFIYEVTDNGKTVAASFFPEDPFKVRGYGGPQNAQETTAQGKSATVVINIPLTDASPAAISKIGLRILQLMPGTKMSKIDSSVLEDLRAQNKIILLYDLPANKLGPAISKKLVKLPQ